MKKRNLGLLALLGLSFLPACATTNGVRWAYGASSIYDKPDAHSESMGARAIFGLPVILVGVACDATTFPLQVIFGVWPMWGSASTQMKPRVD